MSGYDSGYLKLQLLGREGCDTYTYLGRPIKLFALLRGKGWCVCVGGGGIFQNIWWLCAISSFKPSALTRSESQT